MLVNAIQCFECWVASEFIFITIYIILWYFFIRYSEIEIF